MSEKCSIDELAGKINTILEDYSKDVEEGMKEAVKKTAKTVKQEISANAPVHRGKYAKSWKTTTTTENSHVLEITVHSGIPGLPHLLEFGHAKRNGGRTAAQVHIAPAEQRGIEMLEKEIERSIQNG